MSYKCPYCAAELDYIGYRENYGVDITDDGEVDLDSVDEGDVWDSEYYCPKCDHTLEMDEDIAPM